MTTPYLMFLTVAALNVLTPGPSVLMTLTNALRYGARGAAGGILGMACGAALMACISVTALGVLLRASSGAFTVVKAVGAAYLICVGVRLWLAPPMQLQAQSKGGTDFVRCFLSGLTLQLTNPYIILFFMAVFPHFIEAQGGHGFPFLLLTAIYCASQLIIYSAYALFARRVKTWLCTEDGGLVINKLGGASFMCFGAALTLASGGA